MFKLYKAQNSQLKTNNGFTLLELLLVIGVISVIAFFSWLSLGNLSNRQELNNEALKLISLLEEARQSAINQVDGRYWGIYLKNNSILRDELAIFSSEVSSPSLEQILAGSNKKFILNKNISFKEPAVEQDRWLVFDQITGLPSLPNCSTMPDCSTTSDAKWCSVLSSVKSNLEKEVAVFCNGKIQSD